ncbi:O-antigen ligase [Arenibacter algicola]|uniref:O-antigen ligase n=2 Tax=Arenibacter algicola TaxID=616991 RepID=A0A221UU98_9FLAO|nr:O-antigen ligase [Arenibacter algicola]
MEKAFKQNFFYWAISLVLITMPLPKYSLNSQSIILLFLSWLFYNSFDVKVNNLKKTKTFFIIMSSLFWISIISAAFYSDIKTTVENVVQNLPFVIIPLIIFTTIKDKEILNQVLKIFSFSVITASLLGVFKAFYFWLNNLGDYFYYTEFSKVLEIHTTYFALFLVISIVYFLFDIFKTHELNKCISITAIIFLTVILYLVSSRISILALLIVSFYFLIRNLSHNMSNTKKGVILLFVVFSFIAFMGSPNFQNRNSGVSKFGYETPSLKTRLVHWESVIKVIKSNNLIIANGVKKAKENLIEEYRKIGFDSGYIHKYNAHNQFLENTLNFGILGLLSVTIIFALCFYQSIKSNDDLAIILTSIYLIFMLTESILERHSGIISFVIFMSLILNRTKNFKKKS